MPIDPETVMHESSTMRDNPHATVAFVSDGPGRWTAMPNDGSVEPTVTMPSGPVLAGTVVTLGPNGEIPEGDITFTKPLPIIAPIRLQGTGTNPYPGPGSDYPAYVNPTALSPSWTQRIPTYVSANTLPTTEVTRPRLHLFQPGRIDPERCVTEIEVYGATTDRERWRPCGRTEAEHVTDAEQAAQDVRDLIPELTEAFHHVNEMLGDTFRRMSNAAGALTEAFNRLAHQLEGTEK